MTAKFLMVTISPELKSAPNVALLLRDDNDRRLFELGERARELRAERVKNSVATTIPTFEELNLLRKLEFKVIDPLTLTSDYTRIPVGHVLMDGAKLMNTVICMPEMTNLHGKMFGGFLFRTAYETAWSNAAVFANQPVNCTSVTNGHYLRAVPVGALLHISSQVCYTRDRSMQTLVICQVRNANSDKLETAMIFHFTFESEAPLRSLMPSTHADGLRYVHCRRELDFAMNKTTFDSDFH
ncbi:acyl-CoA thioesterase 9-like protein [Aphelenchoides avenae]|nr:acyl-CoA thioesterase 9-like protein [Aphelenchus avenae]